MTPGRESLIRILQDAVWPFLAHDPANPDLFWGLMADKVEVHFADNVERLRAQVAAVEDVLRDLDYPNPEADQDWQEDPVSCIRDALHAALASGDEVPS